MLVKYEYDIMLDKIQKNYHICWNYRKSASIEAIALIQKVEDFGFKVKKEYFTGV